VLRDQVALPVDVLTTVLRWEGVDQAHTVLSATARWMDDDARREDDRKAFAELANLGLADDAGFRAVMHMLARPAMECYGQVSDQTGSTQLLAASGDTGAVLVTRVGETVWLQSIRPDSLVEAVVWQLPQVPAAHGRSLNTPEAELTDGRTASDDEGFQGFTHSNSQSADARMLRALMAEPRTGAGQLHVAKRDNMGRRQRSPQPLNYIDVAAGRPVEGRWMTQLTAQWVYAAPASPQTLTAKLHEMHRALR
jgi:hypothetical protein